MGRADKIFWTEEPLVNPGHLGTQALFVLWTKNLLGTPGSNPVRLGTSHFKVFLLEKPSGAFRLKLKVTWLTTAV